MNRANPGMSRWASLLGSAVIALGCGGSPQTPASSPTASATSSATVPGANPASGAATASATATAPASASGTAAVPATASDPPSTTTSPPAHPFAATAAEATSLIDDAITSRSNELGQCVDAARARRNSPHAKLVVEVGIDEEGHMLGVTLPKKEKHDQVFVDCVIASLRVAPFPKSHAGVITVRKTFEDKAVYR